MKEKELPKWFNGTIYDTGSVVTNPLSNESYELTATELSMYDFIMGCNVLYTMGFADAKITNDLRKGLDWFRNKNPKAYMVLLD